MAKKKGSDSSSNNSSDSTTEKRVRRPREYRFEFRVGEEAYESAGLVLTHRESAQTVKDYLNNLESSQEAGVTYRITEMIILT
jgi:hypothetical protein